MRATSRWLLHAALLGAAALVGAVVTWADFAHLIALKIPPGVLTSIWWTGFAAYAVITTVLVARANDAARVIAAHVIGVVTAPAVTWLIAVAGFGAFQGWEHSHPRAAEIRSR
jgi:hypothetical protein